MLAYPELGYPRHWKIKSKDLEPDAVYKKQDTVWVVFKHHTYLPNM